MGRSGERRRSSRLQEKSTSPPSEATIPTSTPLLPATPASVSPEPTSTPSPNGREAPRKRKRISSEELDPEIEAWKPLTDDDRKNWKGFVELESDPVS